jgi:hypothetical protein
MKVLRTWIFTYEQFKNIKALKEIIQGIPNKNGWTPKVYLTTNDYPNFHKITVYEVFESGNSEFYIERPYYSSVRSGSGTIYSEVLLKASEKQKEELTNILF